MKHFSTPSDAMDYALEELISTLEDDLSNMEENDDDEDREETMQARIDDLRELKELLKKPVVITVSGGNVQGVESPAGVQSVEIHDFDNGGEAVGLNTTSLHPGGYADHEGREYGMDSEGDFYSIDRY